MLVDAAIVGFVVLYAFRGWRRGLVLEILDLAGFIGALLLALVLWPHVGRLLVAITPIPPTWAGAFGGLLTFILLILGVYFLGSFIGGRVRSVPFLGGLNGVGGALFAGGLSLLLTSALLLMAVSVPGARAQSAEPLCASTIGRFLVSDRNPLHDGADGLARLARPALLWVNQRISESFTLAHGTGLCDRVPNAPADEHTAFEFPGVPADQLMGAPGAERNILRRLNDARVDAGLAPLELDTQLRAVARAHARDMYLRGYFAHTTPECKRGEDAPGCFDPFDRIRARGISYVVAGENLALAPTAGAAHRGLMASTGHRENILSPDFTRVGIGVIRGPLGMMVAQEFAG